MDTPHSSRLLVHQAAEISCGMIPKLRGHRDIRSTPSSLCRPAHTGPLWRLTTTRSLRRPIAVTERSRTRSASGERTRAVTTGYSTSTSHELQKLGGDAPAASLMHAKFSPDGSRVAYVRSNNIYVEDLRDHRMTPVDRLDFGRPHQRHVRLGLRGRVNLRDGFRWSPGRGSSIAYWQLDTTGVREFPLVNNTDSLYPRINPIKYPKVGETNAACRVGVVSAAGGKTRWMKVAEQPRNHYLRVHGVGRRFRQDRAPAVQSPPEYRQILLADAHSGQVATIFDRT